MDIDTALFEINLDSLDFNGDISILGRDRAISIDIGTIFSGNLNNLEDIDSTASINIDKFLGFGID